MLRVGFIKRFYVKAVVMFYIYLPIFKFDTPIFSARSGTLFFSFTKMLTEYFKH